MFEDPVRPVVEFAIMSSVGGASGAGSGSAGPWISPKLDVGRVLRPEALW